MEIQDTSKNSEPVGPVHYTGQTGLDRSNRSGVAVRPLSRAALAPEQSTRARPAGGSIPPARFRTAAREDGNRSSRVGRPPCARKWRRNSAQGAGRQTGGGKRRQAAACRVPGGGSTQIEKGSGWGGGVRHDKAHRDLDSSRGRAKMGRRREGRSSGGRVWVVDGGGLDSVQ